MHAVYKIFFTVFHRCQSLVYLFAIYFCVTYFYFQDGVTVASYTDDTTPCSANKTNDSVIKENEHFSKVLFQWFYLNYMKISTEKSHVLSSGNDISANINKNTIIHENENELCFWTQNSLLKIT